MKRWEIYLEILIEILLIAGLLFIIGFVLPKALAFLWPLVVGWIIAFLAHPLHDFLMKKLKVNKKAGSAFIIIVVIALISFAIYGLGSVLIREGVEFLKSIPGEYRLIEKNILNLWDRWSHRLPSFISDRIGQIGSALGGAISDMLSSEEGTSTIGNMAQSITNGLIGVIVTFISAYFFLADWESIHKSLKKFESLEHMKKAKVIKDNILKALGGYLLAQLKLMGIVCLLLIVGFLILPVKYVMVLAISISLVDAIPFLGVGTVLIPWAVYELIAGNTFYAVGLLILYGVCLIVRQVLQPKIVGQSVGLSSLSTLILMYIGMKLGGIIGFIIAVVLGIIVKRLYELGMFDDSIARMERRLEMLKHAD